MARNVIKVVTMIAFAAMLIPATWPLSPVVFVVAIVMLWSTAFDVAESYLRQLNETERELIKLRHEKTMAELKFKEYTLMNERVRDVLDRTDRTLEWVRESREAARGAEEAKALDFNGSDDESDDVEDEETNSPFGELVKL